MKYKLLTVLLVLCFIIECSALVIIGKEKSVPKLDTVYVNEVLHTVEEEFPDIKHHEALNELEYSVFENDGNLLFSTSDNLSKSLNEATANRDTMLNIYIDNEIAGTLVIDNNAESAIKKHRKVFVIIIVSVMAVQLIVCIGYLVYVNRSVIKPFRKLEDFAERVAGGNLEVPLEMDRQNIFGVFTESFDIMRTELKKARLAEAMANKGKKELVAKLSHDIKTPVASIKAVSEVGLALSESERQAKSYTTIISKADQINALVSNLFTATLEELQELTVTASDMESTVISELLANADYLGKAELPQIPECIICADKLRLQQVFDNIFANSYKYAGTEITVNAERKGQWLCIEVSDFGGGVEENELLTIKNKFGRGKNSEGIEGAGLGLFISDYFMKQMSG